MDGIFDESSHYTGRGILTRVRFPRQPSHLHGAGHFKENGHKRPLPLILPKDFGSP